MSWNLNNSFTGEGSGSKVNSINGGYKVSPTYTSANNTSITPSFSRNGNISSMNSNSGVNTYSATVSHPISSSTTASATAFSSSNGNSGVGVKVKIEF